MELDKKYIIIIVAGLIFFWKLCVFNKLQESKSNLTTFIDALFYLIVTAGGMFYLDNAGIAGKELFYFKTPAEF